VAASTGDTVRIDLATGGELRIVAWNRQSVEVRATLRGTTENAQVSLLRANHEVSLSSSAGTRSNRPGLYEYEIRVPSSVSVTVQSSQGSITVDGVTGLVSGRTGSGDIRVDHVNGELRLATGRGEIKVTDSDVTGEIRTDVGDLRLRNVKGSVHAITTAGRVFVDSSTVRATAIEPVR
jgi:hypothetical protein